MSFNPVEFRSRPLFAATCLALLTTALPAGAFVLGEIRTESHLGAPLRASVPLRLEAGEWIDSKCVKIVPDSVSGLEINSALPQARVETATDNTGRIIVSTRQSLSEPIVRFNLQLNCGSGFFSREYTLLLDPEELTEKRASAAPATTTPTKTAGQSGGARERRQLAPASELPPVRRSRPEKPARLAPRAAAKPLDFEPKLRLSADGDAAGNTGQRLGRAAAASSAGGFQLKLTSELNLERIGRKLTANERTDLQQKLQLGRSDDDMAEILRLRNQIETLEAQMLTLRQTAMATMGINPPATAPDKSTADPVASPVAAQAAVGAPAPVAAVAAESGAAHPDNNGNPLGRWADVIIWVLAGAVTLGFGYMLWLYRGQHADNLGLPELFDDHAPEPAYRPDIPISRKLVNPQATTAADARSTDIVVPDKDRWAIEEAQILLAQGWREQAVNLLQEQIDNNPYQLDIWLMLFELHHKTGNSADFATLAARFHNIAKGLPVWNSIRQMGQSLDPENPLYAL